MADNGTQKPRGSLTPAAIAKLHKVIERCDSVECEWIKPGLESALPFEDAAAQIANQRDVAKNILKAFGAPLPDSGTG
jgi:hypothetical protein